MKGEKNSPGQPYRQEDLDILELSTEAGIRERLHDTFEYGIIANSQMAGESFPFQITVNTDNSKINVGSGIAIAPHNSISSDYPIRDIVPAPFIGGDSTAAERIVIGPTDISTAYSRLNLPDPVMASGPFTKSPDGLGGYLPTPQSSGCFSIPVCDGSYVPVAYTGTCYVWIGYELTLDNTQFTSQDKTSQNIYFKKKDGYDILINTLPSAPDTNQKFFLIGTFESVAGVAQASTIDQSMAKMFKTRANRVGIEVGSTGTDVYTIGTKTFLDSHINALGSGTVTPQNPHAVAAINIDGFGYSTKSHSLAAHADGVRNLSANTLQLTTADIPALGQRIIRLKQLVAGEYIVIDGDLNTEVLPKIDPGIDDNAYISFNTGDVSGSYNLYAYIDGAACKVAKANTVGGVLPSRYMLLGIASWDAVGANVNITLDNRENIFGSISSSELQLGSVTYSKLADSSVLNASIADAAVTDSKIVSMEASKITVASGGITAGQMTSMWAGGITGPGQISSDLIGNGITGGQIADDTISPNNLAPSLRSVLTPVPTGTIVMWPKVIPPSGWLNCDGNLIPDSGVGGSGQALAILLNQYYTPDLRGRFPLCINAARPTVAITGGEETHKLTVSEMPSHTHPMGSTNGGSSQVSNNDGTFPMGWSTGAAGGDQAHNNMPPFFTINFIIKL